VTVRAAAVADSDALARLIGQLGFLVSREEVQARLSTLGAADVLVAERDGEIAGCLTTSTMQVLHRPTPVGRVSMLVVDEAARGVGVGTALLLAAEQALAARGCAIVEVTSNLRLIEAHLFYERCGFARTSVRFARELAAPSP
jgi:N-acetylglutamate synthase-like GNAT family acetyltransferase